MTEKPASSYPLEGQTAVVTGAAQGLGLAMVERLARDGAHVIIGDVQEDKAATEAARLQADGLQVSSALLNVADSAQVTGFFEALGQKGRLDILVNNAGAPAGDDRRPIVELPETEWTRVHEVNTKGTFLMCQAGARHMVGRGCGGRIINIASLAGRMGFARYGAYCASKFAIVGLTQVLALELGEHNITVNAICPGLTDTERLAGMAEGLKPEGSTTEAYREQLIGQNEAITPLGRIAQPEDVARSAAFLASDEADFLTGQSISVSGGAWMG